MMIATRWLLPLSIAALLLATSAPDLCAQNGRSGGKQVLQGKVPRNYAGISEPELSKRRVSYAPIVADPRLAQELSERPPEILSPSEYEELKEARLARMHNRSGRSMPDGDAGSWGDWEASAGKARPIVKNEDVDDDSLQFLLWLVGGVSAVGAAFYYWRRAL